MEEFRRLLIVVRPDVLRIVTRTVRIAELDALKKAKNFLCLRAIVAKY
jgi:hypothetical protein